MSLKKQAVNSVIWSSMQQFTNLIISFTSTVILSRLLLPSEFGLVAMIGVLVSIGNSLIDVGLTQSLIRTQDHDDEDINTVFLFNLFGALLIYLIVFSTAPFVADFYKQPLLTSIIRIQCISFIISAFSSIQLTQLTKKLDFKTQFKITTPSILVSNVLIVILALNHFGVWSLVYGTLAQNLVVALQVWFWSSWRPNWKFNYLKFKKHFHFGYKLTLSGLIDTLYNNIYIIIIGKFFTSAQVGFYSRADTLKQLPVSSLSVVLNKVTFPLFAKIQDDDIQLKNVYKQILQLVIFIVAPLILFIAALATPVFVFLFTNKWLPSVPYFQILCWNGILFPIHSYNLNILKVKGRTDLFLKLEVIKKVLIALIIVITVPFGIKFMLYGSVFFSVVALYINTYFTGRLINYSSLEQFKDIFKYIFYAALIAFATYWLDIKFYSLHLTIFFRIFVGFLTSFSFYFLLSYFLKWPALNYLCKLMK